MRQWRRCAALLGVLALVAAACGGDDETVPDASSAATPDTASATTPDASSATTTTEASSDYVSEVDGVMEGVNVAIREVVVILDGTYPVQSALFGAFEIGELADALETARDDAATLEPPPDLESDHGVFLPLSMRLPGWDNGSPAPSRTETSSNWRRQWPS